jgi:hypothetical protein
MKPTHVKKGLFGVRYYYLDDVTRIRYGLCIAHVGTAYTLQRKGKYFWNEVAWTYPETHRNGDLEEVIEYLQWYERDSKTTKETIKCKF